MWIRRRTWAEQIGNKVAAKLRGETLTEEEATDKKLSALAGKLNEALKGA